MKWYTLLSESIGLLGAEGEFLIVFSNKFYDIVDTSQNLYKLLEPLVSKLILCDAAGPLFELLNEE